MIGLIDCNNFFVSCERVFRPEIMYKPVVVMSNNDGCAVAMSNEAKALGINRGVPVFQVKELIERYKVVTLSGNHKLYGDMSSRVMATISMLAPDIEVYSIDECFIDFGNLSAEECEKLGRKIVRKVRRDVGIPTSLGIAPTKTLAKVAAKYAKKFKGYRSVCVIDTEEKRRKALADFSLTDVWGIGRRLGKRLAQESLFKALDFADLPVYKVRELLNVNGERTWRELNGVACDDFVPVEPDRKQICTSRSFSRSLDRVEQLREAISYFCDNIARKLRKQHGCARSVSVFIHTNSFHPELPQHYGNDTVKLESATDDTMTLTNVALRLLYGLFRVGYAYKRAGVIVTDIVSSDAVQQSLFESPGDRARRSRLMQVIDSVNRSETTYDKLHLATVTPNRKRVKQEELSPYYSTRIEDIIVVKTPSSDSAPH